VGGRRRGAILVEFVLIATFIGIPLLSFIVDVGRYFKTLSGLNRTTNIVADIASRGTPFDLCFVDQMIAFEVDVSARHRLGKDDFLVVISEIEIYDEAKTHAPLITAQSRRGLLKAESRIGKKVGKQAKIDKNLRGLKESLVNIDGGRPPGVLPTDLPERVIAVESWIRFVPFSGFLPFAAFPDIVYSDVAVRSYRLGVGGLDTLAPPRNKKNEKKCT